MAFSDVLQSLGRFIGLYSEQDTGYEEPEYNGHGQPEEQMYDEPAQEDPVYQSGYGSGASYVQAGAKPRPAASRRPIEEPSPIQGLFSRVRQQKQQPAYQQDTYQQQSNVIRMPSREEYGDQVTPLPTASMQSGGHTSTIIFCVRRKDDSSQIINYLINGVHVILNFEEVDDAQCQRVLDMVSGAAFALRGTVERISHRNYLVAPTGAEIVRSETQGRNPRDDSSYASMR